MATRHADAHPPAPYQADVRTAARTSERDLDWHQTTTITVTLPDLGKTLQDLDVHERAALAQLILWQHWELELPAAPDTPAETPTLSRSS